MGIALSRQRIAVFSGRQQALSCETQKRCRFRVALQYAGMCSIMIINYNTLCGCADCGDVSIQDTAVTGFALNHTILFLQEEHSNGHTGHIAAFILTIASNPSSIR
jgi:hypothetical protein